MVFSTSTIILMEETKSFYCSCHFQHWFYSPAYMGLGQKHPHLKTLDKQHSRDNGLTHLRTQNSTKSASIWIQTRFYFTFCIKFSRYRPGVAPSVGRRIALLFYDCSTRRGWVISSTPRLHFTPGKDPVPILQEARWDPGPVWTGGKSCPYRDSTPDLPSRSQLPYRLSYTAHTFCIMLEINM